MRTWTAQTDPLREIERLAKELAEMKQLAKLESDVRDWAKTTIDAALEATLKESQELDLLYSQDKEP